MNPGERPASCLSAWHPARAKPCDATEAFLASHVPTAQPRSDGGSFRGEKALARGGWR
jgi:hypothetical protein